jgi:hypothetical protein
VAQPPQKILSLENLSLLVFDGFIRFYNVVNLYGDYGQAKTDANFIKQFHDGDLRFWVNTPHLTRGLTTVKAKMVNI